MWLVLQWAGDIQAISLPEGEFIVGRGFECDLVINHPRISRRHLLLERSGKTVFFRDLGSRCGVLLNGEKNKEGLLENNDELLLYQSKLTILHELPTNLDEVQLVQLPSEKKWQPYGAFFARLRDCSGPRELLTCLLEGLMSLLRVERGFVLLEERRANTMLPIVSKNLSDLDDYLAVSSTVYELALSEGKVIFIADSATDDRCKNALSLGPEAGPRSIVCAPLMADKKPLGVIYLDGAALSSRLDDSTLPFIETASGLAVVLLTTATTKKRLYEAGQHLRELRRLQKAGFSFVSGNDENSARFDEMLHSAAKLDTTVSITGETGSGKEVAAREIHERSSRKEAPFVAVNCAAITPELIEAELFGVKKGAFTDANRSRPGLFELAHGGTIFLDEVGELSQELQVKLLRVLQEGVVERIGGSEKKQVDFRLICATNLDLAQGVREGKIRADFYYRINVFSLQVPPLRERKGDLLPLANYFLRLFCRQFGKKITGFSDGAQRALVNYQWPGNIRELRNVIERAVVLAQDAVVPKTALSLQNEVSAAAPSFPKEHKAALEFFEEQYFARSLAECGGNLSAVVRKTGIARGTLYRKLKKLGLLKA